jgi:dienelactone hydrolase
MADLSRDMSDFTRRDFTFNGKTKPVLTIGVTGPAVIVIHEVFGFTPPLARFCRWIADAGMRVYAPILLGKPDTSNRERTGLGTILGLCVSREFTLFRANRASPVVDWLKPLARQAQEECGGPGVGVIGMCLTGGFALAMAVDPVVVAPALSQPSMPPFDHKALDISPADLSCVKDRARDGLELRAYRFEGDTLSRAERFETLRTEFGTAFHGTVLPDSAANPDGPMARAGKPPHSVMTGDLIDAPGEATKQAAEDVIAFFKTRLTL